MSFGSCLILHGASDLHRRSQRIYLCRCDASRHFGRNLWAIFYFCSSLCEVCTTRAVIFRLEMLTSFHFSAFGPRSTLPGILDVLLLLLEIAGT